MARDCSLPYLCSKCKEEGHLARDCTLPDVKCEEEGHTARDCSLPDTCRQCGQEGHLQSDCTEEETTRAYTTQEGEVGFSFMYTDVSS